MNLLNKRTASALLAILVILSIYPMTANAAVSGTSGKTKWTYSDNTIVFKGKGATASYTGTDVPWAVTKTSGEKTSINVNKVINTAENELQYVEKKSNSSLYDKRANAGNGNFTKYAADLFPSLQANPWCDMFVSWCFWTASGKNEAVANKALCGGLNSAYTPYSASKYQSAGRWTTTDPQVGDQIFFTNGTRISHTGLVYKVTDAAVYTIEGNTVAGKSSSTNGGEVLRKMYARNYARIVGYGHPIYDKATSQTSQLTINKVEFKSGVTKLGSYLFTHRSDVKTVVLPATLTEISPYAFSYCEGITDVYFGGTAAEWSNVKIGTGNYYIEHASMHFTGTSGKEITVSANSSYSDQTSGSLKISSQPSNTTVEANKLHMFSITANAANAYYSWEVSENGGKTWRKFSEKWTATTADLYFTVTANMNGWKFRCKVTKGSETVTSKAFKVTVKNAKANAKSGLAITAQSTDRTVEPGNTAVFKVTANAKATYQWQYRTASGKKWKKVNGTATAQTPTLKLKAKKKFNGWQFRCKVVSGKDTAYSKAVKLTVKKIDAVG